MEGCILPDCSGVEALVGSDVAGEHWVFQDGSEK